MLQFGEGEGTLGLVGCPVQVAEILEDERETQVELAAILTHCFVGHGYCAHEHRHGFGRPPQAVKAVGEVRERRHFRRGFIRFDPRPGCGQPRLPLRMSLFQGDEARTVPENALYPFRRDTAGVQDSLTRLLIDNEGS